MKKMNGLRLYCRYARMHLLAGFQYKGWVLTILLVAFYSMTDPLEVILLFDRFKSVGEWTFSRVMLVYGLAITSFGVAELFSRGLDIFPHYIKTGAFDRMLLRPRSLLLQAMTLRFDLHRIARVAVGILMASLALRAQGVALSAWQILMLALALLGGYLVYTGVFIISSAVSFWTIQEMEWIYIFTNGSYQVAKAPVSMLPRWLKDVFLYIMPMFAFCYYPAAVVCGWGEPYWTGWMALPAGALFLLASLQLWRVGIRHYGSTGS